MNHARQTVCHSASLESGLPLKNNDMPPAAVSIPQLWSLSPLPPMGHTRADERNSVTLLRISLEDQRRQDTVDQDCLAYL